MQCCVSFWCTAEWFSFIYIYMSIYFFVFFSIMVYYRLLNVVLCGGPCLSQFMPSWPPPVKHLFVYGCMVLWLLVAVRELFLIALSRGSFLVAVLWLLLLLFLQSAGCRCSGCRSCGSEAYSMWNLRRPGVEPISLPCIGRQMLNPWATREVLLLCKLNQASF